MSSAELALCCCGRLERSGCFVVFAVGYCRAFVWGADFVVITSTYDMQRRPHKYSVSPPNSDNLAQPIPITRLCRNYNATTIVYVQIEGVMRAHIQVGGRYTDVESRMLHFIARVSVSVSVSVSIMIRSRSRCSRRDALKLASSSSSSSYSSSKRPPNSLLRRRVKKSRRGSIQSTSSCAESGSYLGKSDFCRG